MVCVLKKIKMKPQVYQQPEKQHQLMTQSLSEPWRKNKNNSQWHQQLPQSRKDDITIHCLKRKPHKITHQLESENLETSTKVMERPKWREKGSAHEPKHTELISEAQYGIIMAFMMTSGKFCQFTEQCIQSNCEEHTKHQKT